VCVAHAARLQSAFVVEDVNNIIKESIESVIGNATFAHNKVAQVCVWVLWCVESAVVTVGVWVASDV